LIICLQYNGIYLKCTFYTLNCGKDDLNDQKCGLFLLISLPFFLVIVIEIAGHVAVITTITLFLYRNNIPRNGEMYDAGVAFFRVGRLVFCKI
jgi:hypothetical protein